MDTQQKNHALFTQVVAMFHVAAMQQMGKIKHPVTDKIERNLEGAQNSIDLLDMLKEKTKGNLDDEERKMLGQVLQELKLNYIDESSKPASESASAEGEEGAGEGEKTS
ncbi:MAG: DUF1844 domain-containing protein [Bacteroidetes bacterium]|nr:DUF1844 domain-containing protein [Bacteroidota bacterium]